MDAWTATCDELFRLDQGWNLPAIKYGIFLPLVYNLYYTILPCILSKPLSKTAEGWYFLVLTDLVLYLTFIWSSWAVFITIFKFIKHGLHAYIEGTRFGYLVAHNWQQILYEFIYGFLVFWFGYWQWYRYIKISKCIKTNTCGRSVFMLFAKLAEVVKSYNPELGEETFWYQMILTLPHRIVITGVACALMIFVKSFWIPVNPPAPPPVPPPPPPSPNLPLPAVPQPQPGPLPNPQPVPAPCQVCHLNPCACRPDIDPQTINILAQLVEAIAEHLERNPHIGV